MTSSPSLAMRGYSIKPRTTKYVKGYEFLSFVKKLTIIGTTLDASKTAS